MSGLESWLVTWCEGSRYGTWKGFGGKWLVAYKFRRNFPGRRVVKIVRCQNMEQMKETALRVYSARLSGDSIACGCGRPADRVCPVCGVALCDRCMPMDSAAGHAHGH